MQSASTNPEQSKWGFEHGQEIAPGRHAIKLLGGGFRYEAYLGWDDRLHCLVVIKVVRPGLVDDAKTLEGLESEVRTLDRLSHPVLVRAFGADLEGPRPHVVLEHLEGPRLSSLLRRHGPLAPEQLVPLALQLCSAIHYMAEEGVVHLDVKPSNIIMAGPPRLIDLSVARTFEQCERLSSPVGTDAYMAPEQCRPGQGVPIGPPADVWGVGATLFRAVSGQPAFPKGEPGSPEPAERWPQLAAEPAELDERIPWPIAQGILSCLAPNPGDRPTAGELSADLELVLDALPKPRLSKLKPQIAKRRT